MARVGVEGAIGGESGDLLLKRDLALSRNGRTK
jgi:hypothetical protein